MTQAIIGIKKLETDEDRKGVLRLHIAMNYLGEKCEVCGIIYESVDLFMERNPYCMSVNPLKLCCKECQEEFLKQAKKEGGK